MPNSKIQLANGQVLIDLTADTVDPAHLLKGYTAHNKAGELITGTYTGGGGTTGSIEPTSDTWQHNTWVTLTVDVDEEGNLSIRQSAGGGTTNNLRICYPQGSTTTITQIPNIPTVEGTYELPFTAVWDGDSNDHTLVYTVVGGGGGGGTVTVEPLSVTANGTYTAPAGKAYSPVSVNVPIPVSGDQIGTATVTPGNNSTTVTITGLKGTPKWFVLVPNSNVTGASNSRRITSHVYDGTSDFGQNLYGSGSTWSVTYSVVKNTTNFSHTYSNGTLTLNSGGANYGGYYQNVAHTLIYGY